MYHYFLAFVFYFILTPLLVAAPKVSAAEPVFKLILILILILMLSASTPADLDEKVHQVFENIVTEARNYAIQCHVFAQDGKNEWAVQAGIEEKKNVLFL